MDKAEIAKDIYATPLNNGVLIEVGNDVGYVPTFLPMRDRLEAETWVLDRWAERNRCIKQ